MDKIVMRNLSKKEKEKKREYIEIVIEIFQKKNKKRLWKNLQ